MYGTDLLGSGGDDCCEHCESCCWTRPVVAICGHWRRCDTTSQPRQVESFSDSRVILSGASWFAPHGVSEKGSDSQKLPEPLSRPYRLSGPCRLPVPS